MANFVGVSKAFNDETASCFRFLVDEFGCAGPAFDDYVIPVVSFVGKDVTYEICFDTHEQVINTKIERRLDATRLVADLPDLVLAAGLGARNHVRATAHSVHGLRVALESQAGYVRLLQPKLTHANAVEFLRTANAKEWNIR